MTSKLFFYSLLFFQLSSCSSQKPYEEELPMHTEEQKAATTGDAQALFLLNTGKIKEAIDCLEEAKQQNPYLYHSGTLQRVGLALLQNGVESHDTQDALLALYGIGLSGNEEALSFAQATIRSKEPEIQLTAVQLLANYNTDEAHILLEEGLKSDYLLIRLEAAHALATKKLPSAYPQLEALFSKIDPEFQSFFPQLFAIDGSPRSIQMLRKLLHHSSTDVRLETIYAITLFNYEELIDQVQLQIQDSSPAIQEAVIAAVGTLGKHPDKQKFIEMLQTRHELQGLAAAYILVKLGDETGKEFILKEASKNNLFAISLLGEISPPSQLLIQKIENDNLQVHVNATIALLEQKEPQAVIGLPTLFIQSHNDLAFARVYSPGRSLQHCKVVPSAMQNLKNSPFLFEVSLRLREELLVQSMELPEENFLEIANLLFQYQQHDLIPVLVRLLENLRSEKAVDLLKEQSKRLGSPFIRAYCDLALFRLGESEEYFTRVLEWVKQYESHSLIERRPLLPWSMRGDNAKAKKSYSITLEEKSRLLVESYEALATSHRKEAITALLNAIKNGNPHNRYLLAGLLIRAAT